MKEFKTLHDCSVHLADQVASFLDSHLKSSPKVTLALSGGKSPIAFFKELSLKKLEWSRVNVSLVDERIVPKSNPNSNTALVFDNLLQNNARESVFVEMLGDVRAISEDEDLNSPELRGILELGNARYIQPDVAILGLGADGHIASLFPREDLEFESSTPLILTKPTHTRGVKNASFARISMSFDALLACEKIFLLMAGEDKLSAYRATLDSKTAEFFPLKYILDRKEVHVYYAKS